MEKMTFIVTNSCNLRCKHCFVDAGLKIENELSIEEKYKAIDNLHKLGIKKVTFSGGEPLLDKNLFKYMKSELRWGTSKLKPSEFHKLLSNCDKNKLKYYLQPLGSNQIENKKDVLVSHESQSTPFNYA